MSLCPDHDGRVAQTGRLGLTARVSHLQQGDCWSDGCHVRGCCSRNAWPGQPEGPQGTRGAQLQASEAAALWWQAAPRFAQGCVNDSFASGLVLALVPQPPLGPSVGHLALQTFAPTAGPAAGWCRTAFRTFPSRKVQMMCIGKVQFGQSSLALLGICSLCRLPGTTLPLCSPSLGTRAQPCNFPSPHTAKNKHTAVWACHVVKFPTSCFGSSRDLTWLGSSGRQRNENQALPPFSCSATPDKTWKKAFKEITCEWRV